MIPSQLPPLLNTLSQSDPCKSKEDFLNRLNSLNSFLPTVLHDPLLAQDILLKQAAYCLNFREFLLGTHAQEEPNPLLNVLLSRDDGDFLV